MKYFLSVILVGLVAIPAAAQPVIDGTRAGDSYTLKSLQTIQTGFGDNASEWNAAWADVTGGVLSLMFTGNLEGNFNKLELFIDTDPGGSNVLNTIGNDGSGVLNGMTLDTGITPEYHLIFRRGNAGSDKFDVDLATLNSGAFGPGSLIIDGGGVGNGSDIFGGAQEGSASNIGGTSLSVAFDNSNVAGIGGSTGDPADQVAAEAVETGLELSIDLADLGSPTGSIRVMLLQNNDNHDFLSNQTLGGLPAGTGNQSPAASVDFTQFRGQQFFTVGVPEPTAIGLGLLAVVGLSATRRRK